MTGELGVVSVSQAYNGAEGGVAGWGLRCCGRHFAGLDCVIDDRVGGRAVMLYIAVRGGGRLKALSLCRVYEAVAVDCWSSMEQSRS